MIRPGWYADPSARFQFRWWDGRAWTNQVSSNGVNSIDHNPLEPPRPATSRLGPPPELPLLEAANGPAIVDPLFSEMMLTIEEVGSATSLFGFGEFNILGPTKQMLGHVAQTGNRWRRQYELTSASGRQLAKLVATNTRKMWVLTDANGRQLGEYTHNERLGVDMLMPISIGGQQVAEVKSHDLRGTRLTISDLSGPLASIERPKGFFADSYSTLDTYVMTRHRRSVGFMAYLALMAPVATDEARFRRDVRRNLNR